MKTPAIAPGSFCGHSGQVELLRGRGLGVLAEWTYADFTVQLAPGDRLLFYTDGVTEAENGAAEEFGHKRIAAGQAAGSAAECKRRVMDEVTRFCAGEFRDDVTLLVAAVH